MEQKTDVYTRITNSIVAQLEKGVRPWVKPWNAEHAAGRITRPLRHNGAPYAGQTGNFWDSALSRERELELIGLWRAQPLLWAR